MSYLLSFNTERIRRKYVGAERTVSRIVALVPQMIPQSAATAPSAKQALREANDEAVAVERVVVQAVRHGRAQSAHLECLEHHRRRLLLLLPLLLLVLTGIGNSGFQQRTCDMTEVLVVVAVGVGRRLQRPALLHGNE